MFDFLSPLTKAQRLTELILDPVTSDSGLRSLSLVKLLFQRFGGQFSVALLRCDSSHELCLGQLGIGVEVPPPDDRDDALVSHFEATLGQEAFERAGVDMTQVEVVDVLVQRVCVEIETLG